MLQKPLSSLSTYSEPLQVPKHQIFKYKMIETDSSILLPIFPDDGICIRYTVDGHVGRIKMKHCFHLQEDFSRPKTLQRNLRRFEAKHSSIS